MTVFEPPEGQGALELRAFGLRPPYGICSILEEHWRVLSVVAFDGNSGRDVASLMDVSVEWLETECRALEIDQSARHIGPATPVVADEHGTLDINFAEIASGQSEQFFSAEAEKSGAEKLTRARDLLIDLHQLESALELFTGYFYGTTALDIVKTARILVKAPETLRAAAEYFEHEAMPWGMELNSVRHAAQFTEIDASSYLPGQLRDEARALEEGGHWEDLYDNGFALRKVVGALKAFLLRAEENENLRVV